ncbi:MerR family transcriptional regulator [Streptococcus mitis]|uniref:MerR family transcriptional regulator n=1 Tax=Streptococcus mitis TaxID=28037 RepID=A0A7X1V5R8_STRMT|nr:MerR family transcriptional regulator [Streptococcus mitis]MQQ52286.1 MerR family transcriptional regulator [Streptococcus mitis]
MTNNELIKLNQIEQILNCLLALMQKQENTQKHVSILTQKELLSILKISPNTLKSWESTGLKRLEPPIDGTRTVYYRMEDVLTYLTP